MQWGGSACLTFVELVNGDLLQLFLSEPVFPQPLPVLDTAYNLDQREARANLCYHSNNKSWHAALVHTRAQRPALLFNSHAQQCWE